jgi:hypothetical protein
LSPEAVVAEAASFAFSAAAAVAFSSPAGLGAVAAGLGAVPVGCAAAGVGVGVGVGFSAGVLGLDAGVFAVAAVPDPGFFATGDGFGAVPALGFAAEVVGFDAVPAFGFDGVLAEVGFDVVPAFGFDAVPAFGFGAVADFGAPAAPAFGVVFGLRVLVPAARVRCVRVVLGAGAPVLVPPARGVGAGVSTVVSVSSSWSPRRRPVASDTTLRPRSTTPVRMSLGLMAMAPTVGPPRRTAAR